MTIDPVKSFMLYFSDLKNHDEVITKDNKANPNWTALLSNLNQIGAEDLQKLQNEINWLMSENGVTYNVYNDPKGLNRVWGLNVIPFIIQEKEWETIEKGIVQRANLFDLILKDIYGERKLIKDKIIPHDVIFGHHGFLRQCDKIVYKNEKNLLIYAADFARGIDGRMWILNDRTQAPSGMGYALENRFSTSRIAPKIYKNIHVKQPTNFFYDFNQMLRNASFDNSENPSVVILTPGPHNETYFEHAYLSSYLGYPLVTGNDLVVRNRFVWMKSLEGLKKVDVILRRIDDNFADPLELREDSFLGVAGLLEVVREQNVSIVNPIGSKILENSGLIPFMNAISKYFNQEELILPQIASWWCGQEKECKYVFENIEKLVVKRIDKSNRESIYFCDLLTKKELTNLKNEILSTPYQFVAQEKISFSTAPNFMDGKLIPRKIICRTFAVAKENTFSVMPGGLVRVAPNPDELKISNQRGGVSKDFWVVSEKRQTNIQNYSWENNNASNNSTKKINDLPSNTAENLFWSGRYIGRALVTARFIRVVLNNLNNNKYNERTAEKDSLVVLLQALTNITSTFPGFVGKGHEALFENPIVEIQSLILDETKFGSLAQTLNSFNNSFYSLRNIWSKDMWSVFDSIQKLWKKFKKENDNSITALNKLLDRTITRLIAFMGLIDESLKVDQGLLLYFIGLQSEQATMNVAKFRSLLIFNYEKHIAYEILEALLISHECLNIYRHSYKSYLNLENVLDLILLDKSYGRSLYYQVKRLEKDIRNLPETSGSTNIALQFIEEANQKMQYYNLEKLLVVEQEGNMRENLEELLAELSDLLHETALAVSQTYFDHSDQQIQLINQKIND